MSGPLVVTYAMLFTPGLASALTPSWYAQNEWITSSEVTLNSTRVFVGQLEGAGLDAAVGREAVRELPLLGDHLHLQRRGALNAAGIAIGFGP